MIDYLDPDDAETTTNHNLQAQLAKSIDLNIRYGLAINPYLLPHLQFNFVKDKDDCVRAFLASNPGICFSIQEQLSTDPVSLVRKNLALNPKLAPEFFPKLFLEFKQEILNQLRSDFKYHCPKTQQFADKYMFLSSHKTKKDISLAQKLNALNIVKNFDDKYYLYFMKNDSFAMDSDFKEDLERINSFKAINHQIDYKINPCLFVKKTQREVEFTLEITWSD